MNSPYRRHNDTRDLEARVSSVETAVEHIVNDLGDIKSTIAQGFKDMKQDVAAQEIQTRPKVVAWAGWAGVMLIIIGMFSSGYIRDLTRLEEFAISQAKQNTENSSISLESRTRATAKIEELDRTIHELTKLESDVHEHQKQSTQDTAKATARLDELETEVTNLFKYRNQFYDHKISDAALDAEHRTRLKALEREVFNKNVELK